MELVGGMMPGIDKIKLWHDTVPTTVNCSVEYVLASKQHLAR